MLCLYEFFFLWTKLELYSHDPIEGYCALMKTGQTQVADSVGVGMNIIFRVAWWSVFRSVSPEIGMYIVGWTPQTGVDELGVGWFIHSQSRAVIEFWRHNINIWSSAQPPSGCLAISCGPIDSLCPSECPWSTVLTAFLCPLSIFGSSYLHHLIASPRVNSVCFL
jgi:uncharacterized protein (DUF2237 family)